MPEKNLPDIPKNPGDWESDYDSEVAIEEEIRVSKPKMYCVILLNDDFTPMEFVVWLIRTVFHKNIEEATRLMMDVHQKGRGICGVFSYDVARTKVAQVKQLAQKSDYPLECVMEAVV
ncbi:MAG: ATP-dependent Clp protease adapter ClpS [Deltaproteobacteria bacterium]|nr:ATP-dependent Clp protease adapter ClpS [Deltaproteobacteria bacterium]